MRDVESDLLKKDFEALDFVFKQKGRRLQNGSKYNCIAYEYGYFSPADDFTLITQTPSGHWHIYSNNGWVGDPAMMSTIFVGKIKNKEELTKILDQVGVRIKEDSGLKEV